MNIRKMITLSPRGAELLNEATGGAKEMATGQYLTAVLTQRRRAWVRAIDQLLDSGSTIAGLQALVEGSAGLGHTPRELLQRHPATLANEDDAHALYTLILEYDAGNAALLHALGVQS